MRMQKQTGLRHGAVALAVSERARARSLLELLAESRTDLRQGVDKFAPGARTLLRGKLLNAARGAG